MHDTSSVVVVVVWCGVVWLCVCGVCVCVVCVCVCNGGGKIKIANHCPIFSSHQTSGKRLGVRELVLC